MKDDIKRRYNSTIISQMFWALLPAQILSSATSSLSNIINGLVIGNFLNSNALVALGFVVPLTTIIGAIGAIASGGSRIVAGRIIGSGQLEKLKKVYTNALIILIAIGVFLSFSGLLFPSAIAKLLGCDLKAIETTAIYIRGLSIGFIPTLIIPSLMIFLQMVNKSKESFYSTIVLAVSNLIFSLANVKLFNGGVFGMGVSSSLSQIVTMIYLLVCINKKKDLFSFNISSIDKKYLNDIIVLGSPTALANILYSIRNIVINSYALVVGGEIAVSSLAILSSVSGLFDSVNIGVGATVGTLSSVFVGERDSSSLKSLFKVTLKIGLLLGFAKVFIIVIFGKVIVSIFNSDITLLASAYELLFFYGICMPINMITLDIIGILQSLGKIKFVNILYIFNALIIPLACCFLLSSIIGVKAIWICYTVAEIITLAIIYVAISLKNKKPITSIKELLLLDSVAIDSGYNITIKNINEVIEASENVINFCLENNIDAKRSKLCGLCVEELAGNVVEHGFTKGKKKNYAVDIYIVCDSDEVNIHIRDNAPEFDPQRKFGVIDSEDPTKNIGIRMVGRIAKDLNYQSCFGMNTLTMRL